VLLGENGLVTGGSQIVRCDFTLPTPGVTLEEGGADSLIDFAAGSRASPSQRPGISHRTWWNKSAMTVPTPPLPASS
jgi:hypothetical protein